MPAKTKGGDRERGEEPWLYSERNCIYYYYKGNKDNLQHSMFPGGARSSFW